MSKIQKKYEPLCQLMPDDYIKHLDQQTEIDIEFSKFELLFNMQDYYDGLSNLSIEQQIEFCKCAINEIEISLSNYMVSGKFMMKWELPLRIYNQQLPISGPYDTEENFARRFEGFLKYLKIFQEKLSLVQVGNQSIVDTAQEEASIEPNTIKMSYGAASLAMVYLDQIPTDDDQKCSDMAASYGFKNKTSGIQLRKKYYENNFKDYKKRMAISNLRKSNIKIKYFELAILFLKDKDSNVFDEICKDYVMFLSLYNITFPTPHISILN